MVVTGQGRLSNNGWFYNGNNLETVKFFDDLGTVPSSGGSVLQAVCTPDGKAWHFW